MRTWIPVWLSLLVLVGGCATSGKALVEQYQDVTPSRFEGAVAVVLENRAQARVDDRGESMYQEVFQRIKLLNRKALDCGPDAPNCRLERAVCYNETWDQVEFINVRTITPEGDVLTMDKDDMSDRTFTTWAIPDQDQRCFVYRVKGAAPGAIIEEHYRIRSRKILGVGGFWFQDRDPVIEAVYTLDTPVDYAYKWKVKNIDIKPEEHRQGNRLVRVWKAHDVPPLVTEHNMIAPDDVAAQVKIANQKIAAFGDFPACLEIKTWEDMGRCWIQMIESRQQVTPAIKDVIEKIAAETKTETDKVKAVWKYMNENVRYVGLERGLAGFIPLSAGVVCSKKYGDCKAVAGLISVLCRGLGLRADPILIGTRPQLGDLDVDLPGPFHFNHSIARVEADGKVYWLDATGRYDSFDTTQYRNQGVHVVVGNPEKPFLDEIPVQPPEQNSSSTRAVFSYGGDGTLQLELKRVTTGNTASMLRARAYQYNAKQWRDWIEGYLADSYPQIRVIEQSYQGKEHNDDHFVITIKAKLPKALQPAGKGVSFQVKEFFPSSAFDDFTLPKRRYALDMGLLWLRKSRFEVQIPQGMDVAGMPRNLEYQDEFVELERLSQIEGDRVVTQLTWKNKQLIVPPEKYQQARKAFQKVLDATSFVVMFEPVKKKKQG